MLTWIQTQAKWVIVIGIVFISLGLLLIDTQSLQAPTQAPVATVNGEEIDYKEFHTQYLNRIRGLGGQDSEQDKAQLRMTILKEYAQRGAMVSTIDDLDIEGSDLEAYQYVLFNPPAQVKQFPQFQTDSVFDLRKWQAFYTSDSVTQMQGLRGLEAQVKSNTIPVQQLTQFVALGVQTSDLEAKFKIENAKNRYKLQYLSVPLNEFKVAEPTDAEVDAYFAQEVDSFYVAEDQAQAEMVYLPIKPTEEDFTVQKEIVNDYLHEIKNGVPFEQVAVNSDDEATAAVGGSLGDYQLGLRWPKSVRDAAYALDSGEVSQVVRSRFGYHIIKSFGKKVQGQDTLVKASHILSKVIAGTETISALKDKLEESISTLSETEDWAAFAKSNELQYKTTSWFQQAAPIEEGYFAGLSGHVFHAESPKAVSDVISNTEYVAVFRPKAVVKAGSRLKEAFIPAIKQQIRTQKQAQAAKDFLAQIKTQAPKSYSELVKISESDAKINVDTTDFVGLESSVARFGFANPKVAQIFKAPQGEWTQLETDRYAFLAKWVENQPVLPQQYEVELPRTRQNLDQRAQQMASTLWMNSLISQAKIESNLHEMYSQ